MSENIDRIFLNFSVYTDGILSRVYDLEFNLVILSSDLTVT